MSSGRVESIEVVVRRLYLWTSSNGVPDRGKDVDNLFPHLHDQVGGTPSGAAAGQRHVDTIGSQLSRSLSSCQHRAPFSDAAFDGSGDFANRSTEFLAFLGGDIPQSAPRLGYWRSGAGGGRSDRIHRFDRLHSRKFGRHARA